MCFEQNPSQSILACVLCVLFCLSQPGCGGTETPNADQADASNAGEDGGPDAEGSEPLNEEGSIGDETTAENSEGTELKETPAALYSPEAFRMAAHDGKLRVVEICLEGGLDVNEADPNGFTPLAMASFNGHEAVVKLLLKNKAVVDVRDRTGLTPLYHAASCPAPSAPRTVKALLAAGAEIDAAGGDEKFTALMVAAAEGNMEVVQLLLAEGADRNILDTDGDKAADHARTKGHSDIVKLLESK